VRRLRTPFLRISVALHVAGLVVVGSFPDLWPWVLAALVVDHVVAVGGGLWPRSSLVGPNLRRLSVSKDREKIVALTFDDGPDPRSTPAVLDVLERHGARATFFCIGERVARHPELTRRIAAGGHTVENHTHRHSRLFWFLGPVALTREIRTAQASIEACTGRAPAFFRAPAGVRSPWLDWVLAGSGLRLASWTRRAFDTVDADAGRVVRRLTCDLAPGDILVMHDAGSARDPSGEPVVLRALPPLLTELDRLGFRVTPLTRPAESGKAAVGSIPA
jgi:peptidoglycan/xylan/chitin deacetylase (PgdA/CDA1 family)